MEFFEEAFHWLAGVSEKLPAVDIKMFFIVVLSVILGIGVITAFTLLGSHARKLYVSSKKIRKYLANVDAVDDDNVSDFTAHCFSKKTPQQLRDTWVQYLGVRFGYPSDIVSDSAVYDKFVKKNKDVRSGVFLAISLILLGLFAFWGYGTLQDAKMGVVHLVALVLIGVIYLVLVILARKQNQRCLETFEAMQEDLDAKVNLQIESNYATDSSPLQELNALVEEIIARNTAKAVDVDENEQTPIEALIEQKMKEQSETEEDEQESIDEILNAQEDVEEIAQEESDNTQTEIEEDNREVAEQQHIDELLQEQEEEVEQMADDEDAQTEQVLDEQLEQEVVEPQEAVDEQEEIAPETEEEQIDEQEETAAVEESEQSEPAEQEEIEEQEPAEEESVQEDEQVEEQAQEETVDEQTEEAEEPQIEEVVEGDFEDVAEENASSEETEAAEDVGDVEEGEQTAEAVEESTTDDVTEENEEDSAEEDVASEAEQSEDESEEEQSERESEEIQEAQEDEEPEVVYVVEGDDEDDDEHVKPAKLVKLPNLVDYMLSKNMPKAMKIQIATMLIGTYNKFKDSKEDRKIVVSCLSKVMRDLQSNN